MSHPPGHHIGGHMLRDPNFDSLMKAVARREIDMVAAAKAMFATGSPRGRIGGAHVPPPCDHIGGHMLRDPNFLRFVVVVATARPGGWLSTFPSGRSSWAR